MTINGITTHNLKNLNFTTKKAEIIGVYGVSGGGKSSFAYHTLYSLCADSFCALENGYMQNSSYKIKDYKNIMPSIALKQLNTNTNPHSSIYSYLNFASLLSVLNIIDYEFLRINKVENECPFCKGLKNMFDLDSNLILKDAKLSEIPFVPFRTKEYGNDLMQNLFLKYCNFHNLDMNKKFSQLSQTTQSDLLYTKDSNIFSIKYKHNKKSRTRKIAYTGVMSYLKNLLESNKISMYKNAIKYCNNIKCPQCNASGLNIQRYKDVFIDNISFIDFLTLPFYELLTKLKKDKFKRIYNILESCCNLGIDYLSLNRSIPTLSGGELQKLNFSNLAFSEISNLLIVIDEISSGLHYSDFDKVLQNIINLKNRNNTIILVEHNSHFLSKCDRLIRIGAKDNQYIGGKNAGYIIENNLDSLKELEKNIKVCKKDFTDFIESNNININNIHNQNIKFPKHALSAIIGKSGSGKSSLAKYLESNLSNCIYISQKSLRGNIKSSIASYLEINKVIAKYFAEYFNKDSTMFMTNSQSDIICKTCNGTGIVRYERGFEKHIDIICTECNGDIFNNKSEDFKIKNVSIKDIYTSEIINFKNYDIYNLKYIQAFCKLAHNLSLDYLSLNRKINTLSGGELKRVKILKTLLNSKLDNKILIIDEPVSSLDSNLALKVLNTIKEIKTLATLIIEHNPFIFLQSDFIIELGPKSGTNGGKIIYSDTSFNYHKNYEF